MTGALAALDSGMAANRYVRILKRGSGRIVVTPLERQPEPVASLRSRPRSPAAGR